MEGTAEHIILISLQIVMIQDLAEGELLILYRDLHLFSDLKTGLIVQAIIHTGVIPERYVHRKKWPTADVSRILSVCGLS